MDREFLGRWKCVTAHRDDLLILSELFNVVTEVTCVRKIKKQTDQENNQHPEISSQ